MLTGAPASNAAALPSNTCDQVATLRAQAMQQIQGELYLFYFNINGVSFNVRSHTANYDLSTIFHCQHLTSF